MASKNLQDPTIPDLTTIKGNNVFHTVDPDDTTDSPDGSSLRADWDQMAQYSNSSRGLIKIVDKAGTFFTSLSTANAYVQSFTLATITNESYNNGVYFFTVPSGSIFRESTQFLQSSNAYIIDELGLITGYGDNAFVNNNGNNVFKSAAFDTYAFNSSSGNNTFGNCSFNDDSFAGSSGNNVFGTITVGNNFLNAAAGVNTIENISLVSSGNTFAGYSTGKFYLNGSIGASTAENYTNFFLSSTASIFVKRENLTNNAGGIEGDLARAKVNGASVFFGEFGTLQDVTDNGFTTTNDIELYGVTDGFKKVTSHANDLDEGTQQVYDDAGNSTIELRGSRGFKVHDNAYSGNPLFEVIRDDGIDTDKVVINASKTELTQGTASKLLRLNANKEIVSSSYDDSALLPETAATIAAINHGTTAKTTLVDADEVTGQDSANSFSLIRTTWLDVWAYIKSKADTFYQTIITYTSFGAFLHAATNKTTPVDADEVGIWNSVSGLYEKVSLTNFKAFSKAYTDQFYVQIASNTTIYYYRQLTSDTGLVWRDYNVLVGNCPPRNRLTNFLGWNPAAFSPYNSTDQVVESTNSGTTWVVSAGSPSGITRRHIGTYGKRADGKVWFFGGEPQTPSTAKEVWTFDGTTYTLITSDWGIGFVYLGGFVLHNDIPYLIGGDSDPFGTPTQVLGVYRWNDGTSQFVQVGSLPVGNYSGCIVYSTVDSLVVCSGSKYLSTTPSEYNDKILRSTDNGANWTQIGTLPTAMKSLMGSGIKCYGKYFYLKGLNTSNTNAQGMWYTTDFLTWTETIGKPLASHGRGITVHNTELYGAFGNTLNDCWKIEEINFPYYVSPLLYDWWVNLIVKPSKSLMVKLNTFAQYLDAADKWTKISFVNIIRLMETEEQALRPLRTTSNRIAVNNGVTIDSTGAVGGSGKYIDLNWNPYIDGQADNIYKQNDSCVGVYLFSNIAENAFDFGNGVGSIETSIVGRYTDGNMYTCINSNLEQPVTTTNSLGYRAVTRTSSAGGNQIVNNTVTAYLRTSTGLHNSDFYGCAANGSALYSTKKQGAFFAGSSDLEPVMRQALMDLFA